MMIIVSPVAIGTCMPLQVLMGQYALFLIWGQRYKIFIPSQYFESEQTEDPICQWDKQDCHLTILTLASRSGFTQPTYNLELIQPTREMP